MENKNDNIVNKKNQKRKLVITTFVIISILVILGIVSTATDFTTRMYEIGHKYIDQLNNKRDILYRGDHLILYDHYSYDGLDPLMREERINKSLMNEAIYCIAQKDGTIVSDEDIYNYIKTTREGIEKSSSRDEYLAMLSGMNMREEEYWNSPLVKKEIEKFLVIARWDNIQTKRIINETGNGSEVDIKKKLAEFREAKAKQFLIEDNVKKLND